MAAHRLDRASPKMNVPFAATATRGPSHVCGTARLRTESGAHQLPRPQLISDGTAKLPIDTASALGRMLRSPRLSESVSGGEDVEQANAGRLGLVHVTRGCKCESGVGSGVGIHLPRESVPRPWRGISLVDRVGLNRTLRPVLLLWRRLPVRRAQQHNAYQPELLACLLSVRVQELRANVVREGTQQWELWVCVLERRRGWRLALLAKGSGPRRGPGTT